MTLRTGLIITGDTDGAQKAVSDLAAEMNRAGAAAKDLSAAEGIAEAATERLEAELRDARAMLGSTVAELNAMREASAALAGRIDVLETQLARASVAGRANVRTMGEQALGARMLGQQFQDMGLMVSMSGLTAESALRAFSMQAGQTALAVEQMGVKGAIGRFAGFMGTPWGSIMLTAGIVLAPLIAKLFETSNATDETRERLEEAADAADSFGNAQQLLGQVIDLTTGKLKTQNAVLVQSIRLQTQLNLLEAQKAIDKATGADNKPLAAPLAGSTGTMGLGGGNIDAAVAASTAVRAQQQQLDSLKSVLVGAIGNDALAQKDPSQYARVVGGQLDLTISRLDKLAVGGKIAGRNLIDVKTELLSLATAATNKSAALQSLQALNGGGVSADLTPYERDKNKKARTRKPASSEARDEFGRDAADRIDAITEAFDDTPAAVRQADRAIRQLDDLIDDLGRKKPANFEALIASAQAAKRTIDGGLLRSLTDAYKAPETLAEKAAPALGAIDDMIRRLSEQKAAGFEKLIADAQAARGVIEGGILRPYNDFLEAQEQSLDILTLQAKGQEDQAEALRTIVALERQLGPLRADQKDAILASVQAIRAQQREVEVLRQGTQKYIDALSSIEGIVKDASQAFVRGDLGQFIKTPGKLLDAFQTLKGQELFDSLFSGVFRDLQDQINGTSIVQNASARMAGAVDKVTLSTGRTTGALDKLAAAADRAAGAVMGGTDGAAGSAVASLGGSIAAILGKPRGGGGVSGEGDEVVVTAPRSPVLSPEQLIAKAVGGVGESILKVFTNPESAKSIGGEIGKFAGKGLEGAATGSIVSGISNALGIKMNSTGAQIGGAIGNVLPIPGGSIIGSIAGGLLGSLFDKPDYGTAILTDATSRVTAAGRGGEQIEAASGLAGSLQSGIKQIAEALGGELGSFDTVVGMFDGKYRVRTTASGWDGKGPLDFKGNSAKNLFDFGDDAQAALSFAIADAVKDGAVTGLSTAVQKALGSNSDIDAALKEALKVADVEQLLGGLPAELTSAFKSFEKEAKDRLRIAREYGFDVVEIERINAKERLDLTKQLMEEQVGSLQRLVDEMTSGSLFEGSAVDQRAALLEQIDAAKKDLDAGVAGAADTLAGLYERLNSVSEAVYGTTGGFAVDRAAILDQARAAIAKANADVTAAQARASDPALTQTNAALDENNDQNARMIDALERSNALLESLSSAIGGGRSGLADLVRMAKTG